MTDPSQPQPEPPGPQWHPQPPRQYPPPPGYGYGLPPGPPRMPGVTLTAVIMLWIGFAMGICNATATLAAFGFLRFALGSDLGGMGALALAAAGVAIAMNMAFLVLRPVFAVMIWRRSASARKAAVIAEYVYFGVSAVMVFLSMQSQFDASGESMHVSLDCTGVIAPILIIAFLEASRSKWWCSRRGGGPVS
ncbi:hypothetical protein [Glycomyces sp. MUSA5-2]|uniref:hypothetical protein n=1 Tax=Glycomyces sp. MUSA5-2 TaxID=2053002 RepID=UPI0030094E2C